MSSKLSMEEVLSHLERRAVFTASRRRDRAILDAAVFLRLQKQRSRTAPAIRVDR